MSQNARCRPWRTLAPICLALLALASSGVSADSMKPISTQTRTSTFAPRQHKQLKGVKRSNNVNVNHPLDKKMTQSFTSPVLEKATQSLRGGNSMFNSNNILGAAYFIAFDVALRKVFTANNIGFPSMMAGCLLLFAVFVAAEILKPGLGDAVFNLLNPGAVLLAKWLPIFFVPGLAMLPLAPKFGSGVEVVKVLAVVIVGFFFSLFTVAFPVLSLRAMQGPIQTTPSKPQVADPVVPAGPPPKAFPDGPIQTTPSTPEVAVPAVPAKPPPPKAFPDEVYNNVLAGTVIFGIISTILTRASNDFATPAQMIFMACATISSYIFGTRLPKSFTAIVHPLVTSTILTLLTTNLSGKATGLSFEDVLRKYKAGSLSVMKAGAGDYLLFLLGPCVCSMCTAMYSRKRLMKENLPVVLVSVLISAGGMYGTAAFVRLINVANSVLRISVLPRNVTTALAMAISSMMDGNLALTASVVVMTGIFGATFAAQVLDKVGIYDPVTRGLAVGCSSQGLGVASMVNEPDAFPFAAIGMVLTAVTATIFASIPAVKQSLIDLALGK